MFVFIFSFGVLVCGFPMFEGELNTRTLVESKGGGM